MEDSLLQLFARRLNLAVPSVETDLIETGLLDSAGFVDLLLVLEQEFGVAVSVDDLDELRSLESIAKFVSQRSLKSSAAAIETGAGDTIVPPIAGD